MVVAEKEESKTKNRVMIVFFDKDSGGRYRLLRAAFIRAAFLVRQVLCVALFRAAPLHAALSVFGVVGGALGGDILNKYK